MTTHRISLIPRDGCAPQARVCGNVLDVLAVMRGHRYVLALGSHMHVAEHLSFVFDGVHVRSDVSAAIVGGQEVGPLIVPSGFTLYTVRDGKIDAGRFIRLDPAGAQP